jgi:hypothetical protein
VPQYLTRGDVCPKVMDSSGVVSCLFLPNGPWVTIFGHCVFPVLRTTRYNGVEVELGTASNAEPTATIYNQVVGEYETEGFKWNTTFQVRQLLVAEVILIFRETSVYMAGWAIQPLPALVRGPPTVIPPCTDMTMKFTPTLQAVTLFPVFELSAFTVDTSGRTNFWAFDTRVHVCETWRNWGPVWESVFSPDYKIVGMAEALTGGYLRVATGIVDYSYQRRPQCP